MAEKYFVAQQFQNDEKEKSIISAILSEPEILWELQDIIVPEVFWNPESRQLYQEISNAILHETSLDSFQIEAEPSLEPQQDAVILAQLYQKRLLAILAQNSVEMINKSTESPDELIDRFEQELIHIQQAIRETTVGKMSSLASLWPLVIEEAKTRIEAQNLLGLATVGIPTGILRLDNALGGLQTGIHLLAAEPGQGKTTFSIQLAAHSAQNGIPVLFASFEESLSRLTLKTVCHLAELRAKQYWDGIGNLQTLEDAYKTFGTHLENFYVIEGNSKLKVSQIRARALQIMSRAKTNRCLIIVDYLQRWAAVRRDFNDFRHVVSSLVSELRELAFRLNSPVLVISSQNRGGQGGSSLSSLKESGDLEYSADTAMFLVASTNRFANAPARAVDLKIEKNRYGDRDAIELIFRPDIGTFRSIEE